MKSTNLLKSLAVIATLSGTPHSAVQGQTGKVQFANIENVKVNDAFWSPKFKTWNEVTINDVLNKFEGKHTNAPEQHNAFCNFDKGPKVNVAHRDTSESRGSTDLSMNRFGVLQIIWSCIRIKNWKHVLTDISTVSKQHK